MKLGLDTKYLRTVLGYFLVACLALLLIFYFCYHLWGGFTPEVQTTPAVSALEQDVIACEGYLLRDETVIRASGSGVVDYAVADGERVGKGATVARVYAASDDGSVRRRVMAIDAEIALLEASAIGEGVVVSDTSATDALIGDLLYTIRDNLVDGRYDYARRETDSLLVQLNKRRIITGQVKDYSARIAALSAERASLTARLAGGAEQLSTTTSGYFFYGADGHEQDFACDIDSLTLAQFDAMRQSEAIEDSRAVGKIVTSHVWYLAVPVEKTALEPFTEGQRYAISFPYNYDLTLDLTLARTLTELEREEALLIFTANEMPEGFSYLRAQHVEITTRTRSGLRVPAEAIRVIDGQTCVYVVHGGMVELRRVEILLEQDGDCIVTAGLVAGENETPWLKLYDEVVTEGKDLYVGKVLT